MLHVIYVSFHCSEKMFERIFRDSKQKPGQAVQKYNRLMAEGLAKQKDCSVTVVSEMPITEENYEKKIFRRVEEENRGVHYIYIPLLNKHRIKDLLAVVTAFFMCIFLLKKNKNAVVIADILNAPVALGSYFAAKLFGKSYVAIITDAPQYVYFDRDRAYRAASEFLVKKASAYVFLTQQMNDLFNKENKPYTVIEGLVDNRISEEKIINAEIGNSMRVCMYTGSLHEIYGIGNLVYGFIRAKMENVELHIYGDGDFKNDLLEICKSYPPIKYFGNMLSKEVVKKQREATLLINPRPINAEFTKYSFPSKNMEYMVSGTPVLTTKLPGMPKEYYEYVFLIEDDSQEGIKNALQLVLNFVPNRLLEKGREARYYVLNNKNNMIQAGLVLEMCRNVL